MADATKELKLVISAQDTASAQLKNVQNSIGLVSKAAKSVKGSLEAAATGSKVFATGLLAVGAGAVKMALTAARTETLGVAMEAVAKATGTSTIELNKQEIALKKQGITTQEARSTLTKFMQAELDVSKASEVARVAQDLAVIAGENSSQTTQRLTDAIATMNPMLLREVGIVKNLDEVFGTYAETLGKSAEDLTDVERKEAMVNLILNEGVKVAGAYETAMGTVGKQLTSIPRFLEEAANAIGGVLLPALGFAITAFSDFLKSIYTVNEDTGVTELSEKWKGYFDMLKENIPIIAGIILATLVPSFYALATSTWAAMAPLLPFIAIGAAVGLAVKLLIDHFGGWQETLNKLKPVWEDLVSKFQQGRDFFDTKLKPTFILLGKIIGNVLRPAINDLKKEWDKLLPEITKLWKIISPYLIPALKILAAILGGVVVGSFLVAVGVITLIAGAIIKVITFFIKFGEKTLELGNIVRDIFGKIYGWIKEKIDNSIKRIQLIYDIAKIVFDGVLQLVAAFVEFFKPYFLVIKNYVNDKWNDIKNHIKDILNIIIGFLQPWIDQVKNMWSSIKTWVEDRWNAIKDTIQGILNTIIGIVGKKWGEITDKIGGFVEQIKNKFGEIWGRVRDTFGDIARDVWGWVQNIISKIPLIDIPISVGQKIIKRVQNNQMGSQYISETGLSMLHRGERVIPANQASGSSFKGNIILNMGGVTVNNEADENRLVKKIQDTLSRQLVLSEKGLI